jgi:hypothetical protein
MKNTNLKAALFASAILSMGVMPAQADIIISEVAPWASGNSALAKDWFELTNTGSTAVDITGWKMDDSSNAFASAVALNGITSIAAGESVIFIESATSASSAFISNWFGASAPAGLQIGNYTGSGVGLGTGGDGVSIFDASGVLQAKVSFGTSDSAAPFQTFDNAAGLNNATISLLSAVGTNGAFLAFNGNEIGSPGTIAAVPEASTYAMLLAGLGLVGFMARRRKA